MILQHLSMFSETYLILMNDYPNTQLRDIQHVLLWGKDLPTLHIVGITQKNFFTEESLFFRNCFEKLFAIRYYEAILITSIN